MNKKSLARTFLFLSAAGGLAWPAAAQAQVGADAAVRQIAPSALAKELAVVSGRRRVDPPVSTTPLELTEAVHRAVERHPSVSDAIATLAQQMGGIDVARAGYYPQLRLGLGAGANNAVRSSGGGSGGVQASISASQMLYDFGKVAGLVDQSEALLRRQQAVVLGQVDAVAQQAAEAVVMAHRYQVLADLAQNQVDAVSGILETARLRAQAGISTRADPIQAQSRYDSARANLLQVNSQQLLWRERLRTLLGANVPTRIAPLPERLADAANASAEGTLDAQLDLTPEVLTAQAERRAAEAQLSMAKAQRYPTISLDASANKALGGINPSTQQRNGSYHTVMINVSSAIYQGGSVEAQVRAALAAEEAARMRIETARLNAGDRVRNFREQIAGAQARLGVLTDRRRTIVEVRDLYREQYTLGTRSILDLLNAEQEIYQAAAEQEAVLHDLWQSRVAYIAATGQSREYYGLNNTKVQGLEIHP